MFCICCYCLLTKSFSSHHIMSLSTCSSYFIPLHSAYSRVFAFAVHSTQMFFSRLFSDWLPLTTSQLKCHPLRKAHLTKPCNIYSFSKAMNIYPIIFDLSFITSLSFQSIIILFVYLMIYLLTFLLSQGISALCTAVELGWMYNNSRHIFVE